MKKTILLILFAVFATATFSQNDDCEEVGTEGKALTFYYSGSITQEAVNQATVYDILVQRTDISNLSAKLISVINSDEVLLEEPEFKKPKKIDLEDPEVYKDMFGIALEENESWKDKLSTGKEVLFGKTVKIELKKDVQICESKVDSLCKYYDSYFSNFDICIFFNNKVNKKLINIKGDVKNKEKIKDEVITRVEQCFADETDGGEGLASQIFNSNFGANVKAFNEISTIDEPYYHYFFDEKKHPFHKKAFFSEADYYVIISLSKLNLDYTDYKWKITDAAFTFKWIDVATNEVIATKVIYSTKTFKAKDNYENAYLYLILQLIDTDINEQVKKENITVGQDIQYSQFFPSFYKAIAIEAKRGFDLDIKIKSGKLTAPKLDDIIAKMHTTYININKDYDFEYESTTKDRNGLYSIHLSGCKFDVSDFQKKLRETIETDNTGLYLTNRAGPHYFIYLEEFDAVTEVVKITNDNNGVLDIELRPHLEYVDFDDDYNQNIEVTMTQRGQTVGIETPEINVQGKVITVYTSDKLTEGNTYMFKFDGQYPLKFQYKVSKNNNDENENNDNNNDNTYEHINITLIKPRNNQTVTSSKLPVTISCDEEIIELDFDIAKAKGYVGTVPDDTKYYSKTDNVYLNQGAGRYKIDVTATTSTGKVGKLSFYIDYQPNGNNDNNNNNNNLDNNNNNNNNNNGHGSINKSKHYILNIGISKFKDNTFNLSYAAKDATDLSQKFKEQNQLNDFFDEVIVYTLINEQATKKKIYNSLNEIKSLVKPSDFVSVTFSTHGYIVNEHYYLFPHEINKNEIDYSCIRFDYFYNDYIKTLACGSLVMIDACYSGDIIKDPFFFDEMRNELQDPDKVRVLLMSSQADEVSRERKEWQNGAYTEAILSAFENKIYKDRNNTYIPDNNKNGFVDIKELSDYVANTVRIITNGSQTVPTPFVENLSNPNNFSIIKLK